MNTRMLPLQFQARTDRRRQPDRRLNRVGGRRTTDARRWATNADLFAASTGVLLPWPGIGGQRSTAFDTTN